MQKGSLQKLLVATCFALSASITSAKTKANHKAPQNAGELPTWEGATNEMPQTEWVRLTPDRYNSEKTEAQKRAKRSIASDDNYEGQMSKELKDLRHSILSLRTADDVASALDKLNTDLRAKDTQFELMSKNKQKYSEPNRDYYYIASQIAPLRCLRGMAWRFTPLAEKSGVIESKLASEVMQMAQAMQILAPRIEDLPTPEQQTLASKSGEANISKAVFDYLTLPYNDALLFTEAWHLQEHLYTSCYSELEKSARRLAVLDLTNPIVWDNKMFFGVGTFPDGLDRYKLLGEAERHYSLAMKHNGMHLVSFINAYSLKNYFHLIYAINQAFAKDAGLTKLNALTSIISNRAPVAEFQNIDGVSLMERTAIIKGPNFTNVLTLYRDRKAMLPASFSHLKRAVQELNLTWIEVKDRPADERQVINPVFLTGFRRGITKTLDTWLRLVEGPTELHSRVTDRKVTVNISAIYNESNPFEDLKSLLPTDFDQSGQRFPANEFATKIRVAKDKTTFTEIEAPARFKKHRNFYYGTVKAWDMAQWKKIFPNLDEKNPEDLRQSIRTLQQEWGGSLIAAPFMPFMR